MTVTQAQSIVVIGAGHAGGAVAGLLRQLGYGGQLSLVGDEPLAPYQRPPLSKAWLKGEADADGLALRNASFYADNAIDLQLGRTAVGIDVAGRRVHFCDGSERPYSQLVIATGAQARKLGVPGANLDGVLSLRTARDASDLKRRLRPGARVAVVGAGYVGLEVAASAISLGAEVVVIEREGRLLSRVGSAPLSAFLQTMHEARGVKFMLAATVREFTGSSGVLTGAVLQDGRSFGCDVAVVGVGARPNDELAAAAGLAVDDGILVDLEARSLSHEDIFAIGDVARRPMPLYDCMFRLESVPNALEQAKQAAHAMVDKAPPAPECPWQWSDQYEFKIQIAGYSFDADSQVVRGEADAGRFAVFHLKDGVLRCVEAVNCPPEFMLGKSLILSRRPLDAARIQDLSVPLRALAL